MKPYDPETLMNTPYVGTKFERQIRFEKYMKTRQLPRVHKRFFRLKFGEKFALNGKILQKESAFRAVTALGPRVEVTVWPWTKVRPIEDSEVAGLCRRLREIDTLVNHDSCVPPYTDGSRSDDRGWNKYRDDNRTGPSA